jgi:hypothetical protein
MALLPRFAFALRGEGPIQLPLNDRWRSYRIDEALQWLKSPMHYISQIFMPRDFRPKTTLRPPSPMFVLGAHAMARVPFDNTGALRRPSAYSATICESDLHSPSK